MRPGDFGTAPWFASLGENPTPADIAMAKALFDAGGSPPPPPTTASPPAYDPNLDPGVIAANAQSVRDRHDSIVNFGDPTGTGADAGTAGEAANNPYSIVAQLKKQMQSNLAGVNNTANAHGLLFSGANVQGHNDEYAAGAQRDYNARQGLQASLNAITDKQTGAFVNAYQINAAGGAA